MNLLRRILFVQTSGGLGNQLFQLSNILNIIKNRKNYFIIFVYIGNKNITHEFNRLNDLNINAKVISNNFALILHKILMLLILLCIVKNETNKLTERNPPLISYIRGLYQHPPKKSIIKFLRKKFLIKNNYQRIAIHIRLGDYTMKKVKAEIGLLPQKYFLNCISLLSIDKYKTYFISNGSKQELLDFFGTNSDIKNINLMRNKNDIYELRFLAESSFIIISNSTFSLWAAYLSDKSSVFAPNPWFAYDGNNYDGVEQRYKNAWNLINYK